MYSFMFQPLRLLQYFPCIYIYSGSSVEQSVKDFLVLVHQYMTVLVSKCEYRRALTIGQGGIKVLDLFSNSCSIDNLRILILCNVAVLYRNMGNLSLSLSTLKNAIPFCSPSNVLTPIVYTNISAVLSDLCDHATAISYAKGSVYYAQEQYYKDSTSRQNIKSLITSYYNLATGEYRKVLGALSA